MSDGTALPSYDSLPVRPGAPAGSSWGLWGDDDVLGCLNLLTAERIIDAARLVRKGSVFALNLDLHLPDPPLFNRPAPRHDVLGGATSQDDVLTFNTQSSSQWDGFRHIRSHHGFYNGVDNEAHGIDHWARRGIVGRAVLVDVGRWREREGRPLRVDDVDPIETADIEATLRAQGTEVRDGDVMLLRTGWLTWYRSLPPDARAELPSRFRATGIRPGIATARWLWDSHIAALAADNPAVEVWPLGSLLSDEQREAVRDDPDLAPEFFGHRAFLPLLGLPLGELWDLDALAADCADDGVYESFLTSAPLNLLHGVASPPNALAIK